MSGLYARWMDEWECRLASRATDRTLRPFEWGLEWLDCIDPEADPRRFLNAYVRDTVACSGDFFAYRRPSDFAFDGRCLTFTSPLASPHQENNTVYADWFGDDSHERAVLVLPQWNADESGHAGLCRVLRKCGISALRMSMAYHDRRMPAGLSRADYHVSSNVGRTIHASRQSVIDARACLDWLEARGFRRLGILGTSLGSCIAYIAAAHDPRVKAGVFNHVSMHFGDVVWTGLATRHVRQGFGEALSQDELREYWAPISPATYLDRITGRDMESLLVWARYDTTFLPEYSRNFIESSRVRGHRCRTVCLPCGHYTTGEFPFNLMDAIYMCRFLRKCL